MDFVLLVVLVVLLVVLDQVLKLRQENTRLAKQVERLAERTEAGLVSLGAALPERPELAAVRELVAQGKTVQAVRLWRDATGASLVEAKRQVDDIVAESR